MSMSDEIVLMNGGVIEQIGSPREIFERPATRYAASFIGSSNIIDGTLSVYGDDAILSTPGGNLRCRKPQKKMDGRVAVSVRPSDIRLTPDRADGFDLTGKIKSTRYAGDELVVILDTPCGEITARLSGHIDDCAAGEERYIHWDPAHAAVIGGDV